MKGPTLSMVMIQMLLKGSHPSDYGRERPRGNDPFGGSELVIFLERYYSQSMENITIGKKELKEVVRESVKEIFEQEFTRLRASFLPFVSREEQDDIEKCYGNPARKSVKDIEVEI